jgi:hypothetical protein
MVILEHSGRLPVLVMDHIIGAYQCQRRLMVDICPLATRPLMRLGEEGHRFTPAVAPLLAPRHLALTLRPIPLGAPVIAVGENTRPIVSCGERLNPQGNPGLLASRRQWLYWHVSAGDGDRPAIRFTPMVTVLAFAEWGVTSGR